MTILYLRVIVLTLALNLVGNLVYLGTSSYPTKTPVSIAIDVVFCVIGLIWGALVLARSEE